MAQGYESIPSDSSQSQYVQVPRHDNQPLLFAAHIAIPVRLPTVTFFLLAYFCCFLEHINHALASKPGGAARHGRFHWRGDGQVMGAQVR